MLSDSALSKAKSGYVLGARQVGRALRSVHLLGRSPPMRDRRLAHWAYSLTMVHDTMALAELDVPWWTYRAIDVVDAWLAAHPRPIRAFEWGSGVSSLWLARRVDEVHAVEHHVGFAELMRPAFMNAGVDLIVVPPTFSENPAVPSGKEGYAGQDFQSYVAAIESTDGPFDLIGIDGRAREACLTAALDHLAPGGLIVFDNSGRRRYRSTIEACGLHERRLRGLTPTLPYPEHTSLLTDRA